MCSRSFGKKRVVWGCGENTNLYVSAVGIGLFGQDLPRTSLRLSRNNLLFPLSGTLRDRFLVTLSQVCLQLRPPLLDRTAATRSAPRSLRSAARSLRSLRSDSLIDHTASEAKNLAGTAPTTWPPGAVAPSWFFAGTARREEVPDFLPHHLPGVPDLPAPSRRGETSG